MGDYHVTTKIFNNRPTYRMDASWAQLPGGGFPIQDAETQASKNKMVLIDTSAGRAGVRKWLYFMPSRACAGCGMWVISDLLGSTPYKLVLDVGYNTRQVNGTTFGEWQVSSNDKNREGASKDYFLNLVAEEGGRMMRAPNVHALCVTLPPTAVPTPFPPTPRPTPLPTPQPTPPPTLVRQTPSPTPPTPFVPPTPLPTPLPTPTPTPPSWSRSVTGAPCLHLRVSGLETLRSGADAEHICMGTYRLLALDSGGGHPTYLLQDGATYCSLYFFDSELGGGHIRAWAVSRGAVGSFPFFLVSHVDAPQPQLLGTTWAAFDKKTGAYVRERSVHAVCVSSSLSDTRNTRWQEVPKELRRTRREL